MSRAAIGASLGTIGVVGGLGMVLPNLDKAWSADPSREENWRRVRFGQASYLGFAALVGLLAGYSSESWVPFGLVMLVALGLVGVNEAAMRHHPSP